MPDVILFTSEPMLAIGISSALSADQRYNVVATCSLVSDLLIQISVLKPKIVLIDASAEMNSDILAEMRMRSPESYIVLWTRTLPLERAFELIHSGVRGILRSSSSCDLLLRCLVKVSAGELWVERDLLSRMVQVKSVRLSRRENQLLCLVSRGFSNKQIATELMLSEGTVKVYFSKLFHKLRVRDRFELALYGWKQLGLGASTSARAVEYSLEQDLARKSFPVV